MSVNDLNTAMLVVSLVLMLAVLAVRLSYGTGMPSLLLYLGIGMAMGESGAGIQFENFELTTALGYAALVVILVEGGLTTAWPNIRDSVAPAAVLATLGTMTSVAVVAVAAHYLVGMPWPASMLTGAMVSSTDAAAVFSVLRKVPLPRRLVGMLEAESGFNDAPVVILVVALSQIAVGAHAHSPLTLAGLAVVELVGGALVGLAVGWLGRVTLRAVALPSSGLYPIAVIAFGALAYGAATNAHTSGFLACYLAALVLGNSGLPHRQTVRGFAEGLGWIAQIGLFVLLGLLVSPGQLIDNVVPALVVGAVLLLVARPLSILVSVPWFGYRWREMTFLSWAGLRGAVPIVLATIPVSQHTADGVRLFEMVFVLVFVLTLLQAPTLPAAAKWLGLIVETPHDLDLESSPLEKMAARIMQVTVGPTSALHGVSVLELRLPRGASIVLIVRDGQAMVPTELTKVRHGDEVLIVATDKVRAAAERRLREVSGGGRLAAWQPPQRRRPT